MHAVKLSAFMFLLKFIEDKIAVGRSVYTGLSATLVKPCSLAQDLPWQSQNRLTVDD